MTAALATLVILAQSIVFAQAADGDTRAALQSAVAAEQAGKTEVAIRQFHAILRHAPPAGIAGQARLELVRIHVRRSEWFEAAEQLQGLRQLAPDEAEYAYELGVVYRNLSKAAFEHMQSVAPQSARVEQMFGEHYAAAGETSKAIAAYERAAKANPKLPGTHLALAVIYLRERQHDRALAEIDKELGIAPESPIARKVRQAILGEGR